MEGSTWPPPPCPPAWSLEETPAIEWGVQLGRNAPWREAVQTLPGSGQGTPPQAGHGGVGEAVAPEARVWSPVGQLDCRGPPAGDQRAEAEGPQAGAAVQGEGQHDQVRGLGAGGPARGASWAHAHPSCSQPGTRACCPAPPAPTSRPRLSPKLEQWPLPDATEEQCSPPLSSRSRFFEDAPSLHLL